MGLDSGDRIQTGQLDSKGEMAHCEAVRGKRDHGGGVEDFENVAQGL